MHVSPELPHVHCATTRVRNDTDVLLTVSLLFSDLDGSGTLMSENVIFACKSSCNFKAGNEGIKGRKLSLIFQLER